MSEKVSSFLACASFVVLFPVYCFYQLLAQLHIIVPVLGGYFTIGLVLCFVLSLPVVYKVYSVALLRIPVVLPFSFFIFMVIARASISVSEGLALDYAIVSFVNMFAFIAIFLCVLVFYAYSSILSYFIYWFLFFFSASLIALSIGGVFLQAPYFFSGGFFEFNYQLVSLSLLVMMVLALSELNPILRFTLYPLSVVALYLLGARTEFYGLVIFIFFYEFRYMRPLHILAIFIGLLGGVVLLLSIGGDELLSNRMFAVLAGEDASLKARMLLQKEALNTISEHPLVGAYGSYALGQYSHNILSLWVDLGAFGFFLLSSILIFIGVDLLCSFHDRHKKNLWFETFILLLITIFLLLVAKVYTYFLVPVCLALYTVSRYAGFINNLGFR